MMPFANRGVMVREEDGEIWPRAPEELFPTLLDSFARCGCRDAFLCEDVLTALRLALAAQADAPSMAELEELLAAILEANGLQEVAADYLGPRLPTQLWARLQRLAPPVSVLTVLSLQRRLQQASYPLEKLQDDFLVAAYRQEQRLLAPSGVTGRTLLFPDRALPASLRLEASAELKSLGIDLSAGGYLFRSIHVACGLDRLREQSARPLQETAPVALRQAADYLQQRLQEARLTQSLDYVSVTFRASEQLFASLGRNRSRELRQELAESASLVFALLPARNVFTHFE